MPTLELGGMTFGLREVVIVSIALVAAYMLFVLLRMYGLGKRAETPERQPPVVAAPDRGKDAGAVEPTPVDDVWNGESGGLAGDALRSGLEQEVAMLRDEVDALRGELAALRNDMQQELSHFRASQTVSPIYGDAMQMAVSGYDPVAIAERCGIARAEAELVVALAKSQEH